MKTLNTYINEWKLNDISQVDVEKIVYKKFPADRFELSNIIHERLEDNPQKPYLLDINTSKITNFDGIFAGAGSAFCLDGCDIGDIEELDLHTWNVSHAQSLQCVFHKCYNLKSVNLSGWNTRNVYNINGMFEECASLEYLDLSHFDTRNVKIMKLVFEGCNHLKTLNLSKWNTSSVYTIKKMFWGCENLKEIKGIEHWNIAANCERNDAFWDCPVKKPHWF